VLHDVAQAAVQNAGGTIREWRSMVARLTGSPARFHSDEFHRGMLDERVEHARRVAAAADARHNGIWQAADALAGLLDGFAPDDRLKVAHDAREGMRPDRGAEDIVRRFDGAHPVAHGVVDGIAQRARAGRDRADFGTEQLHTEDVWLLPADI